MLREHKTRSGVIIFSVEETVGVIGTRVLPKNRTLSSRGKKHTIALGPTTSWWMSASARSHGTWPSHRAIFGFGGHCLFSSVSSSASDRLSDYGANTMMFPCKNEVALISYYSKSFPPRLGWGNREVEDALTGSAATAVSQLVSTAWQFSVLIHLLLWSRSMTRGSLHPPSQSDESRRLIDILGKCYIMRCGTNNRRRTLLISPHGIFHEETASDRVDKKMYGYGGNNNIGEVAWSG